MAIFQLFLQNKKDSDDMEFICQFECDNLDWVRSKIKEVKVDLSINVDSTAQLLLCEEDSPYFLKTTYAPENK